jgi:CheY-like chemotaxis protein
VILRFRQAGKEDELLKENELSSKEEELAMVDKNTSFAGKKILLVEDNALNREIFRELITDTGVYIDEAVNGKEAFELFKSQNEGYYSIVFMDIQMPVMNGYEATRAIRTFEEENTKGCIAAHSISNMFFILRKDYTPKERREILSNLCTIFDVEGIDKAKLLSDLANEDFSDFEDCLQMECAKSYGADYIVTRNVSDYSVSDIKAILPSEYLGL